MHFDESCKQPTNDGQEIYRQLSEDNDDKENGQEVVTTTTATTTTTTTTAGINALNFHQQTAYGLLTKFLKTILGFISLK